LDLESIVMAAEKSVFDLDAYRREEDEAVREAARASIWWEQEWLRFPTVSKDADGAWRYWSVPADSGVYQDDWPLGERLARETVAQMRRFPEGSTVLRRILREMDPESTVGQGFLTAIEDILCQSGPALQPL
jgi:hypothetical protein